MNRTLLNLNRIVLSIRHLLPVLLFTLGSLIDCVYAKSFIALRKMLFMHCGRTGRQLTRPFYILNLLISMLLLLAPTVHTMAEGTKQLEPTAPSAANGSLGLVLYKGGWTTNGQGIPFATVGCGANYRLNVYISDPSTEVIYFGFKQDDGNQPLYYQFRDPDGMVVPGYALTSQPTVGTNGHIPNWNQAVAGPKFGTMNPTGYTPLVLTPIKAGNYYIEFAENAAGSTTNMNGTTIEFFDISVYAGNNVKTGRLWSKAWQVNDQIAGGNAPKTDFYILSNDSIVTKLNINRWHGMHFMFYCNEWGTLNTGNWYTDRQSIAAPTQVSWPGDLPQYKIFLNDPDSLVFPTGIFGTICDVSTNSDCNGSVDFLLKVSKPGKIDMTIDVDPKGSNNGEDIKMSADVKGSPGCATWDTIHWNGLNGLGQLLPNGATVSVIMDYLNGLTHLPIYDIETNTYGIMVDIVRPKQIGSSKLSIHWDDTKLPNCAPVCSNFTGCTYVDANNACHSWPTNNQGNLVIYNAWWYYLSGSAASSPVIKRLPSAALAPSGPTLICAGATNVVYTVPPIQFAESYLWTLPDGSTVSTATNSIPLNFPIAVSGGIIKVQGVNTNCGAGSFSAPLVINVINNTIPDVIATPSSLTICSGETTNIALTSTTPNTTFSWTASAPSSLYGFGAGSGNTIIQTLDNNSNAPHTVTYKVTPSSTDCLGNIIKGATITVSVIVNPFNQITTLPLNQSICSGNTFTMNLSATLPGTSFSWTASGAGVTGYSNGTGNTISQTLTNTTNAPANVVYLVTGTINNCKTSTTTYTVTVNPGPTLTNNPLSATRCSGAAFNLALTSNMAGASYSWSANGTPGLSGYSSGSGSAINQTVINSATSAGTVTYSVTPSVLGCVGLPVDYTLTVKPIPDVILSLNSQSICSGTSTADIMFSSSVAGTTYTWTATPSGAGLTGYTVSGSGAIPSQSINNTLNVPGLVNYTVTPTYAGCTGIPKSHIVTINPLPVITNASLAQTICSGTSSTVVTLTSNVAGTSFTWLATPSSAAITGYLASGLNTIPSQTIFNSALTSGNVTYKIIPTSNFGLSCPGTSATYTISVNASPAITGSLNEAVCSGESFGYKITSDLPGTNFTWSRAAISGISNPSVSGSSADISEILINTTNTDIDVEYILTPYVTAPSFCTGIKQTLTVKVRALPQVNAGIDQTIYYGTYTNLKGTTNGGTGALNYKWTPISDLSTGIFTHTPQTIKLIKNNTYTLTVTDAAGCTNSDQMIVNVVGTPLTVVPTPISTTICAGEKAVINANASGGAENYTYFWSSIPAGYTGTGPSITVLPQASTVYFVTVSDGYNTTTGSAIVNILPLPQKYVLTGGGSNCADGSGVEVGLVGSQSGVSYDLYHNGFPVGLTIPGTGSAISFGNQTLAGTYSVKATNISTGCSQGMGNSVPVSLLATPVSFFSTSKQNCSNEPVYFKDLSTTLYGYIADWVWDFGDGISSDIIRFPNEPNISHQYNSPGTYQVTLKVTNSFGCSAVVIMPVVIIEAPVANFQYTQDCSGLETSFRDASYANGPGNKVQYWWDFGNPSTGADNYSDKTDPTHIFSAPGTYRITHIVRNFNNCVDTIVKPVVILTPVPIDFVHGYTCLDGISSFSPDTLVMNVANITSCEWNFGDGVINYQQNTQHTYTKPGSYQVTFTVNDISGCTATKTRIVEVNPLPAAMFNTTVSNCANVPIQFDDISNTYTGFITKWNWDFGDGTTKQILHPGNPDTDHAYAIPGTYIVKLTIISSDSCTAERQQTILINPVPVANFDYNNTCKGIPVQFNDLTQKSGAGKLTGWSWNFGDGASGINNTSSLQNPAHKFSKPGTYQVSLTVSAANGCSSIFVKPITITNAPLVDFDYDNTCVAESIQFSPVGDVIAADVQSWSWSFGDGSTSTLSNPLHTYYTPGNYTVSLTIVNTPGCQNSISHSISILPSPVARFSTNTPACTQNQVDFTNQSSAPAGYIISWEYNFGDGTSTIVYFPGNPNVSHNYAASGTFTTSLTVVTNNNCSSTTTRTVQILPGPVANFDFNSSCLNTAVQFNDLSQGSLVSWSWNFGDLVSGVNNTSNQQNPVHTYQQAGNFIVTLVAQSANGCKSTITRTISVSKKPTVDFNYYSSCNSDTIHFNSSAYVNLANTSSWLWDFGDNSTSAQPDPNHFYATPGTYIVSLTITNQNGCTNVKTCKVQVATAPTALFTSTSSSCPGTAVLFTDLSSTPNGTIDSWNWNFDDGTVVTVNSPSIPNVRHTFAAPGMYEVTLTIRTSAGCFAYRTSVIKINTAPETAFSFANNCSNTPTTFTDLSQAAGGKAIIRWSWNFGDPVSGISNISILQNPQHKFSGKGTYKVTLTTENTEGCTNSAERFVTVSTEKDINFNVSSTCNGAPVSFSSDSSIIPNADISSYLWNFGDGTPVSTLAEPSHVFALPGNYTVTLTITRFLGCNSSISKNISVHAWPVAQFTNTGNCTGNQVKFNDISFSPDGEEIISWAWDFGVNTITTDSSSKQNPAYIYASPGTYNVRLTVTSASGCTATKVMPVNVLAAPQALFSYVAESCRSGSVSFRDESTSAKSMITGWYWEFAPGVYSTLQNPVHVFSGPDTCYNVKLIVTTANGCVSSITQRVCIPTGIRVAINYTQTCFGETTWFTPALLQPADGKIAFYNWNFGDPATGYYNESRLTNPQHTFSKPGTFVVSLNVTDINNCSATMYMSVVVDPLPITAFGYTGGVCDSLIKFTDMTTGAKIARWTWNFGDGKSKTINAPANPNVNHYYSTPGIYEATLITQSLAGCSDTLRKTVRRTPCIRAAIAVKDPVVCQKRSMKFTESSTCEAPIASWQWFFGDNTSATFTSPQPFIEHTYKVSGNYTVKMVVATQMVGGIATDTAISQVAVQPAAKAGYQWQDVCIGKSTLFDNLSQNNNTTIKSYQWNFGDPASSGNTTSVEHPDYKYNLAGEYNVKLVVTNTLGCTDTIVKKVNIFAGPAANFSWKNSCEGKPVYFADNSDTASAAIVNWNWKFTIAGEILDASTKRSCAISFPRAGVYNADLKVTDRNGCSTNIAKEVTITANPVAAFKITENYGNKEGMLLLSNGTLNGTDYEWDFGNGKTSSAPAPVITFDREGHYTIQLIAWNGASCSDTMTMEYALMYKGLYVPNAFNPGHMDPEVAIFKPKGTNLKSYNIQIFDRWGNQLWSSNKIDSKGSPAEAWDGKLHGEILKQDVYVWKISAQFNDGEVWEGKNAGNNENMPQMKSGTVTLIR